MDARLRNYISYDTRCWWVVIPGALYRSYCTWRQLRGTCHWEGNKGGHLESEWIQHKSTADQHSLLGSIPFYALFLIFLHYYWIMRLVFHCFSTFFDIPVVLQCGLIPYWASKSVSNHIWHDRWHMSHMTSHDVVLIVGAGVSSTHYWQVNTWTRAHD